MWWTSVCYDWLEDHSVVCKEIQCNWLVTCNSSAIRIQPKPCINTFNFSIWSMLCCCATGEMATPFTVSCLPVISLQKLLQQSSWQQTVIIFWTKLLLSICFVSFLAFPWAECNTNTFNSLRINWQENAWIYNKY